VPSSSVEILPVEGKAMTRRFLAVPDQIYNQDAHWRPQLGFERTAHLNPAKNPGAASHENRRLYLAVRDDITRTQMPMMDFSVSLTALLTMGLGQSC